MCTTAWTPFKKMHFDKAPREAALLHPPGCLTRCSQNYLLQIDDIYFKATVFMFLLFCPAHATFDTGLATPELSSISKRACVWVVVD